VYPVYSQRLLHGAFTASVSATVPAGFCWVVRDADVYWIGAAAADVAQLVVNGIAAIALFNGPANQPQVFPWRGRQVLNPGDQLLFTAGTVNWQVLVSGYALTLP
jgi:hypothetical protein